MSVNLLNAYHGPVFSTIVLSLLISKWYPLLCISTPPPSSVHASTTTYCRCLFRAINNRAEEIGIIFLLIFGRYLSGLSRREMIIFTHI